MGAPESRRSEPVVEQASERRVIRPESLLISLENTSVLQNTATLFRIEIGSPKRT